MSIKQTVGDMAAGPAPEAFRSTCNVLAVRQASRRLTHFYDQCMAPYGLRVTQFSILASLRRAGPLSINALAAQMVMDRTTLGRNVLPLERAGLVKAAAAPGDRRSKELHITEAGIARFRSAIKGWAEAQARFEAAFGRERAASLRELLREAAASTPEMASISL